MEEEPGRAISLIVHQARAALGVAHVSFSVVSDPVVAVPEKRIFTTYSDAWIERYLAKRHWLSDPVLRHYQEGAADCFWDDDGAEAAAPMVSWFLADSRAHGVGKSGHARYLRMGRNGGYALSVTGEEAGDAFRRRVAALDGDLQVLGYCLFDRYLAAVAPRAPEENALDDIEMLALRLLGAGASRTELARRLDGLGDCDRLLASVLRKLKAKTLQQAIHSFAKLCGDEFFPPLTSEVARL